MRENVPSGAIGTRVAFHQEDGDENNKGEHAESDEVAQLDGDEKDQG